MGGIEAHGVMYLLVHNSKIYVFHTQDLEKYKGEFVEKASASIESIALIKTKNEQ